MKISRSCFRSLFFTAAIAAAVSVTSVRADQTKAAEVRRVMEKATVFMRSIATEGGYVYLYTTDLQKRTAERPATVTQVAIQPPGTPSMGSAFMRAYAATHSEVYLDAARAAALCLSKCRLASGGWNAMADFDPAYPNVDGTLYHSENFNHGQIIKHAIGTTFDDDATQSAVRFLLEFTQATKDSTNADDKTIRAALDSALQGMMRAQYPNGAWPQMYRGEARDPNAFPVKKASIPKDYARTWPDVDYTGYYTMNDNSQGTCVLAMLKAFQVLGRPELLESARRGADFILLAQLPEPQPVWAQQYNFNMEPAWARVHEMPSVCSSESGSVVQALIDIYLETGDPKYLDAAGPAVAWFQRSKVGKNRWARLYELGTNKPVYGDERGGIFYSREELSPKFASDYTWESKFKIPDVIHAYERVKSEGREAIRAADKASKKTPTELEAEVDKIIASLDSTGRWITDERWKKRATPEPVISTKTYIQNIETLADYLIRTAQ